MLNNQRKVTDKVNVFVRHRLEVGVTSYEI